MSPSPSASQTRVSNGNGSVLQPLGAVHRHDSDAAQQSGLAGAIIHFHRGQFGLSQARQRLINTVPGSTYDVR